MNGKGGVFVLVALVSLYQMVLASKINHPLQKRQAALSTEDLTCIRNEFARTNTDPTCTTVQVALEQLYNADDVIDAIGSRTDLFDTFCVQSCGQVLINAWGTCNVYDAIRSVAELLINVCSVNNGRPCYMDFAQVRAVFEDGSSCLADLSSGSCSTDCRTSLTLDVQNYGCCVNIPIIYSNAIDTSSDVSAAADVLFTDCRVTRPQVCPAPANALGQPGTALPASPPPAGSQPGASNGTGQPIAAVAFVLLNSLVAFIMHF